MHTLTCAAGSHALCEVVQARQASEAPRAGGGGERYFANAHFCQQPYVPALECQEGHCLQMLLCFTWY